MEDYKRTFPEYADMPIVRVCPECYIEIMEKIDPERLKNMGKDVH